MSSSILCPTVISYSVSKCHLLFHAQLSSPIPCPTVFFYSVSNCHQLFRVELSSSIPCPTVICSLSSCHLLFSCPTVIFYSVSNCHLIFRVQLSSYIQCPNFIIYSVSNCHQLSRVQLSSSIPCPTVIYSVSNCHLLFHVQLSSTVMSLLYRNFETTLKLVTAKIRSDAGNRWPTSGDKFPPDKSQLVDDYLLRTYSRCKFILWLATVCLECAYGRRPSWWVCLVLSHFAEWTIRDKGKNTM